MVEFNYVIVLFYEVVVGFVIQLVGVYVDVMLGGGGYSGEILK